MVKEIIIRDSRVIKAELDETRARAGEFNALYNEGAEGYDGGLNDKADRLEREYEIAREYESFLAIFPDAETYNKIKDAWNTEIASHDSKVTLAEIKAVERTVGVTLAQMQRAKRMYA